jgi:dethiobiotin synthetase
MMLASIGGTISMGRRFLITGTGSRVGKTTLGCAVGFAMRARGMRVGVMKPHDTLESQDAQALALAVGSILPMELICPFRHSSTPPDAADMNHILRCFNEIAAQNDVVIVEGSDTVDFADLAATLNLEVIVIVGNRLGCIDATADILRRCESRGVRAAGCILCDCDPKPYIETLDTPAGVAYLGRMRHREPLAKSIVEKLF